MHRYLPMLTSLPSPVLSCNTTSYHSGRYFTITQASLTRKWALTDAWPPSRSSYHPCLSRLCRPRSQNPVGSPCKPLRFFPPVMKVASGCVHWKASEPVSVICSPSSGSDATPLQHSLPWVLKTPPPGGLKHPYKWHKHKKFPSAQKIPVWTATCIANWANC